MSDRQQGILSLGRMRAGVRHDNDNRAYRERSGRVCVTRWFAVDVVQVSVDDPLDVDDNRQARRGWWDRSLLVRQARREVRPEASERCLRESKHCPVAARHR